MVALDNRDDFPRMWQSKRRFNGKRLQITLLFAFAILSICSATTYADQFNLSLAQYGTWWMYSQTMFGPGNAGSLYRADYLEAGERGAFPIGSESTFANYFVLNLTGITKPILSITVQLPHFLPEYPGDEPAGTDSGNPFTLTLSDSTPSEVESTATSTAVFDSLSNGTSLGSADFISEGEQSGPDTATWGVTITGNSGSDLVSFLNANLGGYVVLGGSASTNYMVEESGSPTFTVTTVPEPATTEFLWIGAAGSLFLFRNRMRARNIPN